MGLLDDLPTLADEQRKQAGRPHWKGEPHVVQKQAKQDAKKLTEATFRKSVWSRDKGRSRASGKPLSRSRSDYAKRGEVHHVLKRSTNPDGKFHVSRGILLSKTEHALAETRCSNAPEFYMLAISGPEDLGDPQQFIWRDSQGKETKQRVG